MSSPYWTSEIKVPIADWCHRQARDGDLDPTGTGRPAAALKDFSAYVSSLGDGDPRLTALQQVNIAAGGQVEVFAPSGRQRLLLEDLGVNEPAPAAQQTFNELLGLGVGDALDALNEGRAEDRRLRDVALAERELARQEGRKEAVPDLNKIREDNERLNGEVQALTAEVAALRDGTLSAPERPKRKSTKKAAVPA